MNLLSNAFGVFPFNSVLSYAIQLSITTSIVLCVTMNLVMSALQSGDKWRIKHNTSHTPNIIFI